MSELQAQGPHFEAQNLIAGESPDYVKAKQITATPVNGLSCGKGLEDNTVTVSLQHWPSVSREFLSLSLFSVT